MEQPKIKSLLFRDRSVYQIHQSGSINAVILFGLLQKPGPISPGFRSDLHIVKQILRSEVLKTLRQTSNFGYHCNIKCNQSNVNGH